MPHSPQSNEPLSSAGQSALAVAPAATGKCVLVIDDDEAVRKSLSAILTARGYVTLEAESGAAGLARLCESPEIDAVILDHNMPGMNGREVLVALRAIRPELAVVMASGHDLEGTGDASDARLRFVQKALGPRALLGKLGELLQPAA